MINESYCQKANRDARARELKAQGKTV